MRLRVLSSLSAFPSVRKLLVQCEKSVGSVSANYGVFSCGGCVILPKARHVASAAAPHSRPAPSTPKDNIRDRVFVARGVLASGGMPVLVDLVCCLASLEGFCLCGWFQNFCEGYFLMAMLMW